MASNVDLGGDGSAESLWEWIVANQRRVGTIAGAVVVIVGVVLFWRESVSVKNQRADAAFQAAEGAFFGGNIPLARSDLEKLATRYPSTAGAIQGRLLLAQILFGEGKYDEGLKVLDQAASSGGSDKFASSIEERMAAG